MELIYRMGWCLGSGASGEEHRTSRRLRLRGVNLKNGRLLNKLRHLNDFNKLN